MIIGYARVSKDNQNLDRQIDSLKAAGCERIFEEKITGSKRERPELNSLLLTVRQGDVIVINELTRLSRSVKDLFELVDQFNSLGADLKSLKEPWLDTTTPQGKLLFTMFAGISQFERDIIRQRTMEGLAAARSRGRTGGRKPISKSKIDTALNLYNSRSCSISEIIKTVGISKGTLYSYLKKRK